jgi:hypothetical protein
MLDRKLRKDRHPAEVRENVVPGTFFFLSVLVNF